MVNILRHYEHKNEKIEVSYFDLRAVYFRGLKEEGRACYELFDLENSINVRLSYFIGLDWINKENAIHVSPKLDQQRRRLIT